MEIKTVEKITQVYAVVKTNLGEFRVFENGSVRYWDKGFTGSESWIRMEWKEGEEGEEIIHQVRQAGLEVIYKPAL